MEPKTIVLAAALSAAFIVTSSHGFAQPAPNGVRSGARQVFIRTPRGSCGPPDYYIVPRYCYDPRDDRVDTSPYAKPVAPVYGLEYGGP
jgi:hypothetical protein